MEYVWGFYDFTPEHEDEIEFLAGERILVVEKDELYQDGWWKGTNVAGRTGLFPQRYTTTQPPSSALEHSGPTGLDAKALGGPLSSLPEETDSLSGVHVDPSESSGPQGTVMRATMTDIQEAIEQLGVRQDPEGASRSFSFSSTKDSLATDDGEDVDDDLDEHPFARGEDWHKDARKLLAQNSIRHNHKKRSDSPLHRPPIEVEMSDESDDERESPLQKRLGSPAPPQDVLAYSSRDSKADPEPVPTPRPEISTVPLVAASQILGNGHTRHDSDLTIADPISKRTSEGEVPKQPSSPSPTPEVATLPTLPTLEQDPIVSAYLSASPASIVSPSLLPSIPAPNIPPASQFPHPREGSPAIQTAQPPPQQLSVNLKSAHPSEWNVEQVITWLRNKGFDDDVCKKFIG